MSCFKEITVKHLRYFLLYMYISLYMIIKIFSNSYMDSELFFLH